MNGLDPIIATTLATRIDSVLNAVSGSVGTTAQTSGAQGASATPVPATGAGAGSATPAAGLPNSAETTLSNTALALDAILRLDTSLLNTAGTQTQTTLLSTPPSQAGSLSANLASEADAANATGAQVATNSASAVSTLASLLGSSGADEAGSTTATGAAAVQPGSAGGTSVAASLATLTGANSGDPLVNALATALQQAVGNSGLFYESHLSQWMSGTRTSDSLQNEPQAQLNTPSQAGTASEASGLNNKITASLANLLNPGGTSATNQTSGTLTTAATAAALAGAKTGSEQTALPINPNAVVLVRQQLDLLATSQFQWNGQAWPGTPMNLEISRRDADGGNSGSSDAADGQVWHTRITLELPVLGKVEAQLSLTAKQLTARISASAQSAATMANGSIDLRRRTAAAGLDLLSLQIRQAGARPDAGAAGATAADATTPVDTVSATDGGGAA
jgi:hypothetical protein